MDLKRKSLALQTAALGSQGKGTLLSVSKTVSSTPTKSNLLAAAESPTQLPAFLSLFFSSTKPDQGIFKHQYPLGFVVCPHSRNGQERAELVICLCVGVPGTPCLVRMVSPSQRHRKARSSHSPHWDQMMQDYLILDPMS